MTEMELCKAIAAFVADKLSQISWEVNGTLHQAEPKQIIGFYPPKRSHTDDDNPYIFVTPEKGSTTTYIDQSSTVAIYIGARSEALDGYGYMFNALERIRQAFLELPGNIISYEDRAFQMQFPFEWEYSEEQPYPFWCIKIITHWVMPVIQQSDPDSFLE